MFGQSFKLFTINNLIHAKIPRITPKIIHPKDKFRFTIKILKVNNVMKLAEKTNKNLFKLLMRGASKILAWMGVFTKGYGLGGTQLKSKILLNIWPKAVQDRESLRDFFIEMFKFIEFDLRLNLTLLRWAEFLCIFFFTKLPPTLLVVESTRSCLRTRRVGEIIKKTFAGKMSKLPKVFGTNIINPNSTGNTTVQQYNINWSKRIRGNEALAHINMNINTAPFKPRIKLYCSSDPRVSFIIVINNQIFSNNASEFIPNPDNINVKRRNVDSMIPIRKLVLNNNLTLSSK
jgi:hypothetical protein